MEQRNGHVVSTLMWDTTFDDKALGFDLQNRISNWSKFVMPGELDYVFKHTCPEGMALSINSFEVDLGEIVVNELEQQLKKRLESALREKLAEMLRYPATNQNVKLIEQSTASQESLRYFLLNGVMPWNYTGEDINVLVADLFRKQQLETIALLHETGSASTKVRKRIAWQFDESNFKETIRGFEPVSHEQINSLSAEMLRLQHEEQFVRSSVADLGKEIRFWILNYLLSDRGTIFNKLAFMKGILEQMAHRHNIDYSELLLLIEKAIKKPNLTFHVRGEFITVLNMLSQQYRLAGRHLFSGHVQLQDSILPVGQKSGKAYTDPFEIAVDLIDAGYESSRLVLMTLPIGISFWLKHEKKLDDRFVSIFFSACAKAWAPKAVELAAYFAQLPSGVLPHLNQQNVRAISIAYLLEYKEKASEKGFFDYFLKQAAKITGVNKVLVYNKLCAALASLNPQRSQSDNICELIAAMTEITYEKQQEIKPLTAIVNNLNKYCIKILAKDHHRSYLILLRRDLADLIRLDARAILQVLRAFKNKLLLFQTLPLLSSEAVINDLLEADKGPVYIAINVVNKAIGSISSITGRSEIALLKRIASRLAFKALVFYPGISTQLFFKELLKQLRSSGRFSKPCLALLEQQLMPNQSSALAGNLNPKINNVNVYYNEVIASMYEQLLDIKKPLLVVLDNLYRYRTNYALIATIREDGQLCGLLFDRFFINGSREVRTLMMATGNDILKSNPGLNKPSVIKSLGDLFWQCFISREWYHQGFNGLKNNFKAAVAYRYLSLKEHGPITNNHLYSWRNNAGLSFKTIKPAELEALTEMLKAAIATGAQTVVWAGRPINLENLLLQAIGETQNGEKTFAAFALSDNEIARLMHMVNFGHLLYLLTNSRSVSAQRTGDLALIYLLCNTSTSRVSGDAMLVSIYKQMLLINKQRSTWQGGRDQLVKRSFSISSSRGLVNDAIVSKFNAAGFKASQSIRKLIISLSAGQQQVINRLNGEKLKLTAGKQPVNDTEPSLFGKRANLNNAGLKLLNAMPVSGPKVLQWYRQTGKLSAAALQLRIDILNAGGIAIPHWYKQRSNSDDLETGPITDIANVSGSVVSLWHGQNNNLNIVDKTAIGEEHDNINAEDDDEQSKDTSQHIGILTADVINARQRGVTDRLFHQVITTGNIPAWFSMVPVYNAAMLAEEIVRHYPDTLLNFLKSSRLGTTEIEQIIEVLPFVKLVDILSAHSSNIKSIASEIESLHKTLGGMSFDTLSGRQLQLLLYRKLLFAYKSSNYTLLTASRIWNELIWDISVTYKISKDKFLQQATAGHSTLTPASRASLNQLISLNAQKNIPAEYFLQGTGNKNSSPNNNEKTAAIPISVKNAGMVLLSEYVPTLFRLMNLLNGKEFLNADTQLDAVHVLQYAVTGMLETSEVYLPLNKILCGLGLNDAVTTGITLDVAQQEMVSGMILNLVGQWAAIGKTSVEGFRGNWLVRNGLLSETDERWELVVEPRPYDILVNKFPFSYSIIKYQWMDKPLHVKWKI